MHMKGHTVALFLCLYLFRGYVLKEIVIKEYAKDVLTEVMSFYKAAQQPCSRVQAMLKTWNLKWGERFKRMPMLVALSVTIAHHRHHEPNGFFNISSEESLQESSTMVAADVVQQWLTEL